MSETLASAPTWIEIMPAIVAAVAPFIALSGAIFLFFNKRKSDRVEAIRLEKLSLFRKFIGVLERVYADLGNIDPEGSPEVTEAYCLYAEISLICDVETNEQAATAIIALINLLRNDDPKVISKDGKERGLMGNYHYERDRLIKLMRIELESWR